LDTRLENPGIHNTKIEKSSTFEGTLTWAGDRIQSAPSSFSSVANGAVLKNGLSGGWSLDGRRELRAHPFLAGASL
jgi:phage baseplate assembly protein gpV